MSVSVQRGFIVTFPFMHVMYFDQIHPLAKEHLFKTTSVSAFSKDNQLNYIKVYFGGTIWSSTALCGVVSPELPRPH
jgi:hypothetical protein